MKSAINTLREKHDQILVEAGVSTTKSYYERPILFGDEEGEGLRAGDMTQEDLHPCDLLFLSVFKGEYIDPSCVGQPFPQFETL